MVFFVWKKEEKSVCFTTWRFTVRWYLNLHLFTYLATNAILESKEKRKGTNVKMKRIDFEKGTVTGNILGAALPMLVAQILNLLYNIVDRVYIARIPEVGIGAYDTGYHHSNRHTNHNLTFLFFVLKSFPPELSKNT